MSWWKAAEKAQDEFGFDDDDWEAAEIAAVAVTATAATKKRKWNDHEDKVDRSPFFSGPSRTKRVCALSSATATTPKPGDNNRSADSSATSRDLDGDYLEALRTGRASSSSQQMFGGQLAQNPMGGGGRGGGCFHCGQGWNTTHAPGLIADVAVLLVQTNHDCQRLCKDIVWKIGNLFLRLRLKRVNLSHEFI